MLRKLELLRYECGQREEVCIPQAAHHSVTHSAALLLVTFLAFPVNEFLLNKAASSFTDTKLDDLLIGIGSEVAQAGIFAYFADFSRAALGFFGWMLLAQLVNIALAFREESLKGDQKFFFDLA